MLLKNSMCHIRTATQSDVPLLSKWWSDGRVMEHVGFPDGLVVDEKALGERLQQQVQQEIPQSMLFIIETTYRVPIGEMSYRFSEESVAKIGIKVCESSYQELGLGTQSLKLLIAYLFDTLKVKKVKLDTLSENKRAQHVYEKIGFKNLGISTKTWKDQLGNERQIVDFELSVDTYVHNKSLYA